MYDGAAEAALRGDGGHALRLGGHGQRGQGRRFAYEIDYRGEVRKQIEPVKALKPATFFIHQMVLTPQ